MTLAFEHLLEQAKVAEKLDKTAPISRFAQTKPLYAMILMVFVPQFIGSFFNIFYNSYQIVRHLTLAQQAEFDRLLVLYNPICYTITVGLGVLLLRPTFRALRSLQNGRPIFSEPDLPKLRRNMLDMPKVIILLTTLGWVPACFFFPIGLNLMTTDFNLAYSAHFVLSIGISWIIALSYSFLGMKYLTHYIFYPQFLGIEDSIQKQSRIELGHTNMNTNFIYILGGAMPLLSAILLLLAPTSSALVWEFDLRLLTAGLILCGTIGFVLSIFAALRIAKANQAYAQQ